MTKLPQAKHLAKLSRMTLWAVYLLIFVGAGVRSTGAGMGCPDWPKCFDTWIPPTKETQLPDNYKEVFYQKRIKKNTRLANRLQKLGWHSLAEKLQGTHPLREEATFNVFKTWAEYINRIIGVVIGMLIMATFLVSLPYYKEKPIICWVALSALLLVVLQGWIGSVVVSTSLLPGLVTLHMVIALLIISLLVYLVYATQPIKIHFPQASIKKSLYWLWILTLIVSIIQILLGTQVREAVDLIAIRLNDTARSTWVAQLGNNFEIHRFHSMLVLLLNAYSLYLCYQSGQPYFYRWSKLLILLIVATIGLGVILAYQDLPRLVQPFHLLSATIIFGVQLYLFLLLNASTVKQKVGQDDYP
ncbi:MAG: COX15/CtaA family protein [Cytophagales bacterium]|nr:COX15/CtaA family protein [Cytophagales bacterium]